MLGTEWALRAFDGQGAQLWSRPVPDIVQAVNITGDGRLVVAAYGDGTIRWHRMADGVELLAFRPLPDRTNWVAWTPEGFYAATVGAHGALRWHVNRGWDAPAESIPVANISGSFHPALLPLVLQELETLRALGLAGLAEHRRKVAIQTGSGVPPGARRTCSRWASAPTTTSTRATCGSTTPTATPASWRACSRAPRAAFTPGSCRRC